MQDENIVIWLPSPLGDAILSTPALRAMRKHFGHARITFLAAPEVRRILSPCTFNDSWLELNTGNPLTIAGTLREHRFTRAILLKNSFVAALAVFLAAIPSRTGYARDGRSLLLTDRLHAPKLPDGKFRPISMIDYYLAVASWLGAATSERGLELSVDPEDQEKLRAKLPAIFESKGPLVILVPGGAFGPSKFWPADKFSRLTDRLIENYGATVVLSVTANELESKTAGQICNLCKQKLINLAQEQVTLGELKALFAEADLVVSNDTGPRHIAIALGRRIITIFGPNDPAWTDTGWEKEIQLIGRVHCAPCAKPKCEEPEHFCMQAVTVEIVYEAAKKLLEKLPQKIDLP